MNEPDEDNNKSTRTSKDNLNDASQDVLADSRSRSYSPSRIFALVSWACVAALVCIIFFMSGQSGERLDSGAGIITMLRNALIEFTSTLFGHYVDVSPIGHFTEFFLLGAALVNALRLHLPLSKACMLAVAFASLYGVTDELHQIFVPGRSCDPLDWLVDTIAALIAALLTTAFLALRQKQKNSRMRDSKTSL